MDAVRWQDEERGIIYWSIDNSQTVDDILEACDRFSSLAATYNGPLYPILDFTRLSRMQSNIVRHFPSMAARLPVGQGRAAFISVVSQRIFIRTLISIFSNVFGDEYRHYPTLESALEHIARHQAATRSTSTLPEV